MKVQVGIISHKPGKLFERCIESLTRHNAGIDYELLLQLTEGSHAQNWNRLVSRANCDFLCILEDDTAVMRPLWLSSLVESMNNFDQAAIIMPIESKDGINPDPSFSGWLDKTSLVHETYGFCNLFRMEAMDGVKADERLTYFVDIDIACQVRARDWRCYCNGHVLMLHGDVGGRMSTNPDRMKIAEADKEYYQNKWNLFGLISCNYCGGELKRIGKILCCAKCINIRE